MDTRIELLCPAVAVAVASTPRNLLSLVRISSSDSSAEGSPPVLSLRNHFRFLIFLNMYSRGVAKGEGDLADQLLNSIQTRGGGDYAQHVMYCKIPQIQIAVVVNLYQIYIQKPY